MADIPTRHSGPWTGFAAGALVVLVLVLVWAAWSRLHPMAGGSDLNVSIPRPAHLPIPPRLPEGPKLPAAPLPRPN